MNASQQSYELVSGGTILTRTYYKIEFKMKQVHVHSLNKSHAHVTVIHKGSGRNKRSTRGKRATNDNEMREKCVG